MSFYYSSQEKNWKSDLNQRIESSELWIDEINQDNELSLEDKKIMIEKEEGVIKIWKYRLEHNISEAPTVSSFIYDSYSLNTILILFSIYLASKILSVEYKLKTLEPLLLRNVSKRKIITFKLLALVISIIFLQILFLLISISIGLFIGNGNFNPIIFSIGSEIIQESPITQIIFVCSMSIFICISYAIIVFMMSTFITNQTILAFSGVLFHISGSIVSGYLGDSVKYNLLNFIYILQYMEKKMSSILIINTEFLKNIVILVAYNIFFIIISYVIFDLLSLRLLQRIKNGA